MPGPGPGGRPISSPDSEDEAVTRVGKLPPELQRYQQNQGARPAQAPAPVAQAPAQPRKAARRRTLSRGEQSPLAQGRRPTHDGREPREQRGHGHAQGHAAQAQGEGRGHSSEGRGHAQAHSEGREARGAPAADPRKQGGRQLPSEVPTAPGNDARAGAARAAALRALHVVDDEVTAQRDVAVLQRLRELKDLSVDDLDEDTSVLPGEKIKEATAAALAKKAAEEQARAEERARAAAYAAAEDDRPTPPDADAELSSTGSPDTSRTSVVTVEAAAPAPNLTADTGRYSAIDALWVTSEARHNEGTGRGRSPTIQNPAAIAEAAAADAAIAAAHAKTASHAPTAPQASARAASAAGRSPDAARAMSGPDPSSEVTRTVLPVVAPPAVTESPVASAPASPVCAFRVAVFPADRPGGTPRVVALPAGAAPPAGATAGMLVATTDAESAELARIFGYTG